MEIIKRKIVKNILIYQFEHFMGAQKNRLLETVLLSNYNIYFG